MEPQKKRVVALQLLNKKQLIFARKTEKLFQGWSAMAMVDHQIESFVQKFRVLWASGLSAHLDLECGGGEAWVGLRLQLGRHRAGGGAQE